MRYLLMICDDEQKLLGLSEADGKMMMEMVGASTPPACKAPGRCLAARPTADATTVRSKGGQVVLSDGPFAETKEQLGGYFIIEAADLDDATKWAGKMPHLPRSRCSTPN